MVDVGTLFSAVQTLFAALQCSQLKDLCSSFTYKNELKDLRRTVDIIKSVLQDAESKQAEFVLSKQAQLWIEELKDGVRDADDLVHELVSIAAQKKLKQDGSLSQKITSLFSRFNSPFFARKMSKRIKKIRERLDGIAGNHNTFGFKIDCQPIRKRREETCSYVDEQEIIGREQDVENIVGRLVNPDVQHDVSHVAIVGIEGLGKTTLAQLVYNDVRVKENFPLRLWVCVGDLGQANLDVKAILCKILHSVASQNYGDLSLDHLQRQLREKLEGKKFVLVLDDLRNEARNQWLELEKFLRHGSKGSWIIITTRSEKTVEVVGDKDPYRLKGLSNGAS